MLIPPHNANLVNFFKNNRINAQGLEMNQVKKGSEPFSQTVRVFVKAANEKGSDPFFTYPPECFARHFSGLTWFQRLKA